MKSRMKLPNTVSAKSLGHSKLGGENASISSKLRTSSGGLTLSDYGTSHKSRKSKRKTSGMKDIIHQRSTTKKIIQMLGNLKKFKGFYKKLSKLQKDDLTYYKSMGYIAVNKYLYNNNTIKEITINKLFINAIKKFYSANTKSLIDLSTITTTNIKPIVELWVNKMIVGKINSIDEIFKLAECPKLEGREILYRGTQNHTGTNEKSKVGDMITFKNFLSTSTQLEQSENFAGEWNKKQLQHMCCLYVLHNLKDVPYIYIPWIIAEAHTFEKWDISKIKGDEFEYLLPRGLKFKITKIDNTIFHSNITWKQTTKKLNFSQLNNIIKASGADLSNDAIKSIYDKTNLKIRTYHLEYVGQEPVTKLASFVYNPSLNLHIIPVTSQDEDNLAQVM